MDEQEKARRMIMEQSTINIIMIYIAPFVFGFLFRFLIRKRKKVHQATIFAVLFATALWIYAYLMPNYGSEANGIRALMTTMMACGMILSGILCRVMKGK